MSLCRSCPSLSLHRIPSWEGMLAGSWLVERHQLRQRQGHCAFRCQFRIESESEHLGCTPAVLLRHGLAAIVCANARAQRTERMVVDITTARRESPVYHHFLHNLAHD